MSIKLNGGEIIVRCLEEQGVERLFVCRGKVSCLY